MPRKQLVRARSTAHAWRNVFDRFESSGLTQEQFCRRNGLALSTFQRWRRLVRGGGSSSDASKFIEIVSPLRPAPSSISWSLEVFLPGGASLRFQG